MGLALKELGPGIKEMYSQIFMPNLLHSQVDEIHRIVQKPINFLSQLLTLQVIISQQTTSPPGEQQ